MKLIKYAVAAALAFAFGNAYAFHSGGVAECEGCHSMHNSLEGSANVTGLAQYASGPYLLKARDQSGACLNCHENAGPGSYHISTPGVTPYNNAPTTWVGLTPGGDFAWLKKTMTTTIRGGIGVNEGDRHGHNIIAIDFGYGPDKVQLTGPGGSYPASSLACSSCHDPHGRYRRDAAGTYSTTGLPIFNSGSYTNSANPVAGVAAVGAYRILGGVGYQPKSLGGSHQFANDPPSAVARSTYNVASTAMVAQPNTGVQTDLVSYGRGMSEWCGNCHGSMVMNGYTSGMAGLVHPAGSAAKLTTTIAANYAAYVSSGRMTGTNLSMSAIAPFEVGVADATIASYTSLKASATAGNAVPVAGTANVLCLSCHRAHAGAFESMARYSIANEFMTAGDSTGAAFFDASTTENKINQGFDAAHQQVAYNNRPATNFGPYARDYCNKCHAKD